MAGREEVPPAMKIQVLQRDNWTCQHIRKGIRCGLSVGWAELEIHHVVRLADGGKNELDNLLTLCRECHIKHHQDELAAISPLYAKKLSGIHTWRN